MTPLQINGSFWIAWGIYWFALSKNVNKTRTRESSLSRSLHLGPTGLAFFLLFAPHIQILGLGTSFLSDQSLGGVPGVLVTALGLSFTAWARIHLGRYWSASVTLKEGHKLIRTGPYLLARHPIYTGFFFGFLGSALNRGTVGGWLGLLIVIIAYLRKMKMEEKFLTHQFGDEYVAYKKEVKAIIPFVL
jgi:protein-S-isoprenylcysteine O-methyltransferase Ste14